MNRQATCREINLYSTPSIGVEKTNSRNMDNIGWGLTSHQVYYLQPQVEWQLDTSPISLVLISISRVIPPFPSSFSIWPCAHIHFQSTIYMMVMTHMLPNCMGNCAQRHTYIHIYIYSPPFINRTPLYIYIHTIHPL